MSVDHDRDRRKVLQMAGGVAAGLAMVAGSASATDDDDVTVVEDFGSVDTTGCDCYYENKCENECSDNPNYIQVWERECCECDGDKVCEDWYRISLCCG